MQGIFFFVFWYIHTQRWRADGCCVSKLEEQPKYLTEYREKKKIEEEEKQHQEDIEAADHEVEARRQAQQVEEELRATPGKSVSAADPGATRTVSARSQAAQLPGLVTQYVADKELRSVWRMMDKNGNDKLELEEVRHSRPVVPGLQAVVPAVRSRSNRSRLTHPPRVVAVVLVAVAGAGGAEDDGPKGRRRRTAGGLWWDGH